MTSERKLAANRDNARRSTGPRSALGKARSSKNAMRHGVFAEPPVLVLAESPAAYEAHREALLVALSPIGYLETLLVERVASITWRLRRLERWEATATDAALGRVPQEHRTRWTRERGSELRFANESPEAIEADAAECSRTQAYADAFAEAVDAGTLDAVAVDSAREVATQALAKLEELESDDGSPVTVEIAGVALGAEDGDTDRVTWTGPLAWAALEAVQGELDAAGVTDRDGYVDAYRPPDDSPARYRLRRIQTTAASEALAATRAAIDARALRRKLEADAVLNDTRMEAVSRYETFLERGLARTLATLREMQAQREGAALDAAIEGTCDEQG